MEDLHLRDIMLRHANEPSSLKEIFEEKGFIVKFSLCTVVCDFFLFKFVDFAQMLQHCHPLVDVIKFDDAFKHHGDICILVMVLNENLKKLLNIIREMPVYESEVDMLRAKLKMEKKKEKKKKKKKNKNKKNEPPPYTPEDV